MPNDKLSPEQIRAKIQDLGKRKENALERLVPLARAAVNVLRDTGHPSTAAEIEAQLFAFDACREEMLELCKRDMPGMFAVLFRD